MTAAGWQPGPMLILYSRKCDPIPKLSSIWGASASCWCWFRRPAARPGPQLHRPWKRFRKCLEKDRNRRYETANSLATDIQRHLDSEPVVARPPSTVYRFQKLVRRNKLQFAAAT